MADFRSLVHGFIFSQGWLARHYLPFARQLRIQHGIRELAPVAPTRWHRGSRYFRACDAEGRALFIKTDGDHRLLANEIAAGEALQAHSPAHFVPIRRHDLAATYPFAAFDWREARTLASLPGPLLPADAEFVAQELWRILEALAAAGLIHRDLTPENLLVVEEQGRIVRLLLIDFAFVVTHGEAPYDERLPALDLEHLGWGFKPAPLRWDDAFSSELILRRLAPVPTRDTQLVLDRMKEKVGVAVFIRNPNANLPASPA